VGTDEAAVAEDAMVASYAPVRPTLQKSISMVIDADYSHVLHVALSIGIYLFVFLLPCRSCVAFVCLNHRS
jgi:hypothetical protein